MVSGAHIHDTAGADEAFRLLDRVARIRAFLDFMAPWIAEKRDLLEGRIEGLVCARARERARVAER